MAWHAPKTWTPLSVLLSDDMNSQVRDNFLESVPAKASGAGQVPYAMAANAVAMLAAGTAGQYLRSGGAGPPTWQNPSFGELHKAETRRIYLASDQSIPDSTWTTIAFASSDIGPNSWFDSTAHSIIPDRGSFAYVYAQCFFAPNGTGSRRMQAELNGSGFSYGIFPSAGGSLASCIATAGLVQVNGSSDALTVQVYQDSGGALSLQAGGGNQCFAIVYLLPGPTS